MTEMVRKARRTSLVTTGLLFAGMLVVAVPASGISDVTRPVLVAIFGVFLVLFFWIQRRSAAQARRAVESITIEVDDQGVKQITSLVSTTIRREDVVELRYLPGGIMVLGRDLRQRIFLNRELDGFDDLAGRMEQWAPAITIRKPVPSPGSGMYWFYGLFGAHLCLFISAVLAVNPRIAIPCCLTEAIFLLTCMVWIWTFQGVASRLKWFAGLAALPAFSLLDKAYTLWRQS